MGLIWCRYGGVVSVFAPSEGASGPLDAMLRHAGAVFSSRNGHPVAIHYGSAAGELSVCVSAVGLVDRSDLFKLEIQTPGDRTSAELSCAWPAPSYIPAARSGPTAHGGVGPPPVGSWCSLTAAPVAGWSSDCGSTRCITRCAASTIARPSLPGSGCWPRSPGGARRGGRVRPVRRSATGGAVRLAARSPASASRGCWSPIAARSPWSTASRAADVWRAIELAGRPFGISCVGQEAAGRYAPARARARTLRRRAAVRARALDPPIFRA